MKKKKSALILIVLVIIFLVLFGFFLKDILGNQNEEVNQSLETETDEEPTTEVIEEESEEQEPEEIVYELVSEKKTNANGEVVVDYQYPVFHANVSLYETAVEKINHDYEDILQADLSNEALETDGVTITQTVDGVYIKKENNLLFVEIVRTQEVGGPHPNTYAEDYVIKESTGDFAKLTDVVTPDDAFITEVASQMQEDHPEKDVSVLESDVKVAIENDRLYWRLSGTDLTVWMDYTDVTDGYHGDGEYAAVLENYEIK